MNRNCCGSRDDFVNVAMDLQFFLASIERAMMLLQLARWGQLGRWKIEWNLILAVSIRHLKSQNEGMGSVYKSQNRTTPDKEEANQ